MLRNTWNYASILAEGETPLFKTFVNRENNWALTLVLRFYDRKTPRFDQLTIGSSFRRGIFPGWLIWAR